MIQFIVYCLSSAHNNYSNDECKRKSQGGIVTLTRPAVIGDYNKFMGGVDLADMRRLHCNSTIMGQHRWWLKLFFYLLDVGTANSLVLYREAMNNNVTKKLSLVDFKRMFVHYVIGETPQKSLSEMDCTHKLIKIEGNTRPACVRCALVLSITKRTRYVCQNKKCNLPLCSVGPQCTEDCFALSHANSEIHELCLQKHQIMLRNTNNRGKP